MVGLSFTLGLLGALHGGRPTSLLVDAFGFQTVGVTIFLVGCAISLAIYLFVRDFIPEKEQQRTPILQQLKTILTMPRLLIMAIANLLMVGPLEGFADVWGVTYLMRTYNFDKATAAQVTSFIFVGMLFGGPLLAAVAERLKAYYSVAATCGFLMAAFFIVLLMFPHSISHNMLCVLMLCTGALCCYQVLLFAIGSQMVSFALMGVTVAFLNCINMFGGSFFHLVIGFLLDVFWTGTTQGGLRIYSAANFAVALMAIPSACVLGAFLVLFVRPRKANATLGEVAIKDAKGAIF
jgi:sugar phosphate permease